MEWLHEIVATKWREQSKQYAQDMNEFVRIGVETDWLAQQEEPQDERYTFAPQSSYPHYSLFNVESTAVWYNACHFYNGATATVNLAAVQRGEGRCLLHLKWSVAFEMQVSIANIVLYLKHRFPAQI